jgi:hypothetical protein
MGSKPTTRAAIHSILRKHDAHIGSCCDVLATHDRELVQWLIEQTPKGGTISETLVSMALDVFHEEAAK